eukprot:CCRYP_007349-RC/>CCRYP_007349-RC protein AED:0.49 eAED:0.49 QI:0/-1/0/1/-1/0/1/0/37
MEKNSADLCRVCPASLKAPTPLLSSSEHTYRKTDGRT